MVTRVDVCDTTPVGVYIIRGHEKKWVAERYGYSRRASAAPDQFIIIIIEGYIVINVRLCM